VNIKTVTDKLIRGSRPEKLTDVLFLKNLGVRYIINLQSGVYEAFNDDEYEHLCKEDLGLGFIHIHCSDFCAPTLLQVRRFIRAVGGALAPVYVHCLHGKDRTGFMVACYRMSQGWTYEAAKKEMIDSGYHTFPYWVWYKTLKSYEGKL
jgi:protein tyrosine/serine phosphatase